MLTMKKKLMYIAPVAILG